MFYAVFFPFIAGIIVWFLFKNKVQNKDRSNLSNAMIGIGIAELVMNICLLVFDLSGSMNDIEQSLYGVGGLGLGFVYSGFRSIFAVLTAFAWFVTFLFSKEYMKDDINSVRYDLFNLLTLGATMGIFYAADLFTVFFFFEIMSFTSFMWVAHRQSKEALEAAGVYLGIAVAGGLSILMGLFVVYYQFGTLTISELSVVSVNYPVQSQKFLLSQACLQLFFATYGNIYQ